jgi:triphosphoribosyl-dephospho-CoA synthase
MVTVDQTEGLGQTEPLGLIMQLTTAQCVSLACLLEVTATKPGNVHRGADFDDLTFADFLVSGVTVGPILAAAGEIGVGRAILRAVEATRQAVGTNSNLGMVLLLAPLAAVPRETPLRAGVDAVLQRLTADDAAAIWQAISAARPGGLGRAKEHDVAGPPPGSIVDAMRLAADRDLVAAQYANGFAHVFDHVVPHLCEERQRTGSLLNAIVRTHVRLLARFPDSLIARKAGAETAARASLLAQQVLDAANVNDQAYHEALADFDFWLRSDGRQRNPGTTADLIAAGLFAALRDELINPPYK